MENGKVYLPHSGLVPVETYKSTTCEGLYGKVTGSPGRLGETRGQSDVGVLLV